MLRLLFLQKHLCSHIVNWSGDLVFQVFSFSLEHNILAS